MPNQLTRRLLTRAVPCVLLSALLLPAGEPKTVQAYNELADGLCRKAHYTGDLALFTQADDALKKSLELSPGNYDAHKLQVVVLLGRHQFQEALRAATELNHKVPDDIANWGLLVDANLALGNDAAAEHDAQWILDLRPGSRLGFLKAAAVRERFGDAEGAIEFLDEAARRTSPNDRDELAWIEKEKARLRPAPRPVSESRRQISRRLAHATTNERIKTYEALLAASPGDLELELGLIPAYLQKLRETADATYLDRASKLVGQILGKDDRNFAAMRFQNEIDLERHDFKEVAARAEDMAKYAPSDQGNWGTLGDALMELGEYERAGNAYVRMLALRPNLASYNRLAYFRFVTGDAPQAIALMTDAVVAGDAVPANTAWCASELGDMYFKTGKLREAAAAYREALRLFPALHRAYAGLGRVEAAQGQTEAAIQHFERAQSIVPMVEYAGALEDLYHAAGRTSKAQMQRELIETIEKLGQATNEKTNRNLALVLANHSRDLSLALHLMETELPVRGDVYTWDALGWVLFKNGRLVEARTASAKATRLGTPEPEFYHHAREIAQAIHE